MGQSSPGTTSQGFSKIPPPTLYWTGKFIIVIRTARNFTLFSPSWIHSRGWSSKICSLCSWIFEVFLRVFICFSDWHSVCVGWMSSGSRGFECFKSASRCCQTIVSLTV
jgi:hypothetical protein